MVRTLDAGSDKPLAFATHEGEENPALGVRGLRLSFDNPGLLEPPARRRSPRPPARTGTETWVMAPMVATVAEATDFAAAGPRARVSRPGVMVEVPSAALLADRMLEVVDFLSIGTNDLTQYTMAADRMATDLAHLTDAWQPAVLQLIAITAEAGKRAGKPVGVCGEAAADPLLACVLVGHGHHVAVDGVGGGPPRRAPGWRRSPMDALRGGRRGRTRRERPDGRPRAPCAPCSAEPRGLRGERPPRR